MHLEYEPSPESRDAIKCFWYNSRDYGAAGTTFEVVPDGYAEIIFHFGSGCDVVSADGARPLPSPFMMGLPDRPVHFHAKGVMEIIGIRCYPWTVFDLLGLPPGDGGVQAFEHPVASLQPALAALVGAGKIEEAIAVVSAYFLDARSRVAMDSVLFKAGEAMRQANGAMPVSDVAAAAHATVRTLERNFKRSSGRTVKDVSGLIRFEQARNRLWMEPGVNLAGLAHELGYTDQAHMSREFKRYSGATPAAFARDAKKGKRMLGGDFVAFIQA